MGDVDKPVDVLRAGKGKLMLDGEWTGYPLHPDFKSIKIAAVIIGRVLPGGAFRAVKRRSAPPMGVTD